MVLGGNSGIRGEDTKLPAERTGTSKRATWKKRNCLGIALCYKLLHRVGLRVQGQLRRKPAEKRRMDVFFSYVGTYRGG